MSTQFLHYTFNHSLCVFVNTGARRSVFSLMTNTFSSDMVKKTKWLKSTPCRLLACYFNAGAKQNCMFYGLNLLSRTHFQTHSI